MTYTANNRKGFTLVEILVVLALTIVILGLVFGPVISSFNFTRQAETMVSAQDNARFALEQISRDLADAMFVYDNTNQPINFPVVNASGGVVTVPVLYAKVDIVLPRMIGFCTNPAHTSGQKEYPRHDPKYPQLDAATPTCPVCGADLDIRPAQPLAQDNFIVRYFIGLADPSQPYKNGYITRFAEGADNMYVLYRVEFSPFDDNLFDYPDTQNFAANISDANFFYGSHSAAWRAISRPIVTIPNTDLINLEFDPGTGQPLVTPTVKFTPTAIYNDPLVPTTEADDDPEHGSSLPTVYKASYGYWTTPIEVTLSGRTDNQGDPVLYKAEQPAGSSASDCMIRRYPESGSPSDVFNISEYLRTKGGGWVGNITPAHPEVAFTIDANKGTVDFAFPVVDSTASNNLHTALGFSMPVSKEASTDDINAAYDAGVGMAGSERYRKLELNRAAADFTPIGNPTVVAGSEKVLAPGAAPGANYDKYIRYTRIPNYLYEPDLNQYQLDTNYDDGTTNSPLGLACLFFHSYQTHQPGSGVPLPPGKNLYVYYEVQNNREGDTLRANYVTKSLLTVIMGIRIYDPTSGKPQSVQLTNKVKLRNIAQ